MNPQNPTVVLMPSEPLEYNKAFIRWMIKADLPHVALIERSSFTKPWTEEEIQSHTQQRNCISMVVEVNQEIIAYFCYQFCTDHLLITNIAVHPDHRKNGIGKKIICKIYSKLKHRYKRIAALVLESCYDTLSFFEKYSIQVIFTEKKGQLP